MIGPPALRLILTLWRRAFCYHLPGSAQQEALGEPKAGLPIRGEERGYLVDADRGTDGQMLSFAGEATGDGIYVYRAPLTSLERGRRAVSVGR